MNKEECLQRVNDYCSERSYDAETLTDEFKDKFAEFFAKRHEEAGIDDDGIMDEIKFNLDTAKSAAAKGITLKQKSFESKESDYTKQIEELKKKIAKQPREQQLELPKEVQDRLDRLEKFENEENKKTKFKNIVDLAKKEIRQDLHASFDSFASDYDVDLDDEDEKQAKYLSKRFQEIFKDSIGDIKPLAPKQVQQRDEEFFKSLKKVKVQ